MPQKSHAINLAASQKFKRQQISQNYQDKHLAAFTALTQVNKYKIQKKKYIAKSTKKN